MSKTRVEPRIVDQKSVICEVLYGGVENQYYSDPEKRRALIKILESRGQYRVTAGLRSGNNLYASRLFDSEEESRADANRVYLILKTSHRGQGGMGTVESTDYKVTYCYECGRWNTLKLKQEAWADVTTCSADDCDFESRYSIGD